MTIFNQICPNWTKSDQIWSTLAKFDQLCPNLINFAQIWPELFKRIDQNLPNLTKFTKFDQIWAKFDQIWPKFDQNLTKIWPQLTKFDQSWPNLIGCLPLPCHLFQDTKGASLYLATFSKIQKELPFTLPPFPVLWWNVTKHFISKITKTFDSVSLNDTRGLGIFYYNSFSMPQ